MMRAAARMRRFGLAGAVMATARMRRFGRAGAVMATAALLLLATSTPATAMRLTDLAPDKIVKNVSSSLLVGLKRTELDPDRDKARVQIRELVDEHIAPAVDFRRVSYRAMGKNYKKVSKEEFLAFVEAVKDRIINTYANPLYGADLKTLAEKLELEIVNTQYGGKNNDKAIVKTFLKLSASEKYEVVFFLYKKKSSDPLALPWLVENLAVEGVNLGLSFRNQFQLLYTQHRGDMQKITNIWANTKIEG